MRSVLILRPGALGDALLTLPLLDAVRARGAVRILLLGTPASWGFLDEAAPLEIRDLGARDWLGLFGTTPLPPAAMRLLAAFDTALVLLGGGRSEVEKRLAAAGVAAVHGAAPLRAAIVAGGEAAEWAAPWPPADDHAAWHLLRVLPDARAEDWPVRPALVRTGRERLLVLHPGSGGAAKCWPAANFAALAAAAEATLGLAPVFLVGPADRAVWEVLQPLLPRATIARALIDRPLHALPALFARAAAFVGNDSGISHLAARAAPTLVLFGPSEALLWHPLGAAVRVLRAPGGALGRLSPAAALGALGRLLQG